MFVYLLCLVFICVVLTFVLINYPSYKRRKQCLDKIPSPKGLPLIGHALEIKSAIDTYEKFTKWTKELGNLFKLNFAGHIIYVTTDVGLFEFVLSRTVLSKKAKLYYFMSGWLGDGLLLSTGEKWQKHRKAMQATFHIKHLEQFVNSFDKHLSKLIQLLENEAGNKSIEITHYMNFCVLDLVSETIMGVNINSQENKNSDYVEALRFLLQNIMDRSFSLMGQTNFTYSFTIACKEERKQLNVVHNFINTAIKERREKLINQEENKEPKLSSLLDMLLLQSTFTDEEIRDEVNNFMTAAYETTALTLSFVLYCLSTHPFIQETAYKEVHSIFQNDINRKITYSDLTKMNYLKKVIKETLRIYTTGQQIGREICEDFEYKGNVFLKGCDILLYFQGAHCDPNNFPNPHDFDPERWNNDEEGKRPSYSYLPFSVGPRNCIGQKFAMLVLECVLAKILLNFEVVASNPRKQPILAIEATLKPTNGIYVGLKKRHFNNFNI